MNSTVEPPTSGKVVLYTSMGSLEIELWCKEAPLASRSFVQLCLEGRYDNSPFHRLVPGFIIQSGLLTRKESNGKYSLLSPQESHSIYEGPDRASDLLFVAETSPKLSFTRRGLVGVASLDSEDGQINFKTSIDGSTRKRPTNPKLSGSQFFITLGEASDLDRTTTLFGKITGQTIYNLIALSEQTILDGTDQPAHPAIIKSTKVLEHPFDDLIIREVSRRPCDDTKDSPCHTAPMQRRTLDKKTLSFADELEPVIRPPRKASRAVVPPSKQTPATESSPPKRLPANCSRLQEMREKISAIRSQYKKTEAVEIEAPKETVSLPKQPSLARLVSGGPRQTPGRVAGALAAAEARKPKKTSVSMRGDDEMETLLALNAFRQKISGARPDQGDSNGPGALGRAAEVEICKLHGLAACGSCRDTFGMRNRSDDSSIESNWMMHRLVFNPMAALGPRQENLHLKDNDELVVIDPLKAAADAACL